MTGSASKKQRGADTYAAEYEAALYVVVANAPAYVPPLALAPERRTRRPLDDAELSQK